MTRRRKRACGTNGSAGRAHENGVKPFLPQPRTARPSALEWPHVNINDALDDDDLAIYRELEGVNQRLAEGSCHILRVRANYGVGNVASAFGPELFVMPREADTLPNVRPFGEEAHVRAARPPRARPFVRELPENHAHLRPVCGNRPQISEIRRFRASGAARFAGADGQLGASVGQFGLLRAVRRPGHDPRAAWAHHKSHRVRDGRMAAPLSERARHCHLFPSCGKGSHRPARRQRHEPFAGLLQRVYRAV